MLTRVAEAKAARRCRNHRHTECKKSLALTAYSWAFHLDADPVGAYDVQSPLPWKVAQDGGLCRGTSNPLIAIGLSRLAGGRREPAEAFDFLTIAIRNYLRLRQFLT